MGPTILISLFVPLSFFALIFGIVYIRNRENMALIERGINPRQREVRPKPFVNLKYGLLLLGCGFGLLTAYLLDVLFFAARTLKTTSNDENPAIYFALIAIGGGIGLVISYSIEKREWLDSRKDN